MPSTLYSTKVPDWIKTVPLKAPDNGKSFASIQPLPLYFSHVSASNHGFGFVTVPPIDL
jgi:hypothetical protein